MLKMNLFYDSYPSDNKINNNKTKFTLISYSRKL